MKKVVFPAGCMAMLLGIVMPLTAADGDPKKGQAVFDNCAICHNSDSEDAKVGPGLKNLYKRAKLVNGKPVNDANVRELITNGTSAMPGFDDGTISASDKDHLIAFLKGL
jgi:mono/diheme cytochrome c family protein